MGHLIVILIASSLIRVKLHVLNNPFEKTEAQYMGELIPLLLLCIEIIDRASDDSFGFTKMLFYL